MAEMKFRCQKPMDGPGPGILLSRGLEIAGEVFAGLAMTAAVLALWLA